MTPEQRSLLDRAGIEYEVMVTDVDPGDIFLLQPNHLVERMQKSIGKVPGLIDIGNGLRISKEIDIPTKSLSDTPDYLSTPLSELNIRFFYLPKAISNFISEALDFPTDTIVDRVSQDSVYTYNRRLELFLRKQDSPRSRHLRRGNHLHGIQPVTVTP